MSLLKSEFDYPEHDTYKWTKFDFINEKIKQAIAEEREACADLMEYLSSDGLSGHQLADAIRSRP